MTPGRLVLSLLILLSYAVFGLAPIGLAPTGLLTFPEVFRNHAQADEGEAIRFLQPGIIKVRNSAEWLESAIRNDQFDIDLRVQPLSNEAKGPARILTMSLDPSERNLTIGQQSRALIVRVRRPGTDINGTPGIRIRDVFAAGSWADLRVAYAENELRIQVNGQEVERLAVVPGALANWSPDYEMALGNELTMDRPWLGNIQRANISAGNVRLDLLARENHRNPAFILNKLGHSSGLPADMIVNLLGFVPLGVLLALWVGAARWTVFVLLALVIGSISAGIETFQLSLPSRTSSVLDFGLNVLGGVAGMLLTTLLTRRKRMRRFRAAPEGAD